MERTTWQKQFPNYDRLCSGGVAALGDLKVENYHIGKYVEQNLGQEESQYLGQYYFDNDKLGNVVIDLLVAKNERVNA